jgi:hypothetical protein
MNTRQRIGVAGLAILGCASLPFLLHAQSSDPDRPTATISLLENGDLFISGNLRVDGLEGDPGQWFEFQFGWESGVVNIDLGADTVWADSIRISPRPE